MNGTVFRTIDTVDINDRGRVHVVEPPPGGWPFNPRELTGKEVILDGERRRVRGVETFAINDGPTLRRNPIGLLI